MNKQTETLDKLYLEWSQFTTARTSRELALTEALGWCVAELQRLKNGAAVDETVLAKAEAALAEVEGE